MIYRSSGYDKNNDQNLKYTKIILVAINLSGAGYRTD